VTIELAQRLLHGGAPAASIEAALVAHAQQGKAFVSALLECSPELSELVERELSRVPDGTLEVHLVRPSRELGELLPRGLCERLLAVPLRRDAEGGVDVAAVDVSDPHVSQEFGFHLQAPVRLWRAELSSLRAALASLPPAPAADRESQAPSLVAPVENSFPSRVPTLRPARSSNPPIPLIRHPGPHPVFSLKRPRVHGSDGSFQFARTLDQALAGLSNADSADAVADAIVNGCEPADALVLAVHREMFEARAAGGSLAGQQAPLGIPSGHGSLLDQALKFGSYLGPVAPTAEHAELRARLGETVGEVYALPIQVMGRPVLMLLTGRHGPSLEATRRANRLGEAAEQSLERIVRLRRRKSERA
jgi:hypothetical protein